MIRKILSVIFKIVDSRQSGPKVDRLRHLILLQDGWSNKQSIRENTK